jgi:lipid A 3-O-deacylase
MRRLAFLPLLLAAAPAQASELFAGLLAHDVDTPITAGGFETGADLELGWRGGRIQALGAIGAPSPYAFVSIATAGKTDLAAAGLSWRIGGRLFARPGIGLAIHDRSSRGVRNGLRTDLGSRVLFEPELGIGYQLSRRVTLEASWVHVSHAQLFGGQNPGMDSIGLRLSYGLR